MRVTEKKTEDERENVIPTCAFDMKKKRFFIYIFLGISRFASLDMYGENQNILYIYSSGTGFPVQC